MAAKGKESSINLDLYRKLLRLARMEEHTSLNSMAVDIGVTIATVMKLISRGHRHFGTAVRKNDAGVWSIEDDGVIDVDRFVEGD